MAQSIICYVSPEGGIDDRIAQFLDNGLTKEDIGTLRGLYEMDKGTPLIDPLRNDKDIEGLELAKIANSLMEYKNSQVERHKQEMKNSQDHMAKTFNQLYHVDGWNAAVRRNRINMIATEFTAEVSRRMAKAKKEGVSLSREQITNGYKKNGVFYEGQLSIFESIFDKFMDRFNEARAILADFDSLSPQDKSTLDKADYEDVEWARMVTAEYPKILSNWAALCTFARMSLRDTESLKLGQTFEYAAPTSPDNFSMDSPLEDTYDLEESVREAWMTHQSETSAYGSLGSEVRRFLSTIVDVDEAGNPKKDDLGYPITMDPVETHQYLADLLRGITTESGLIRKLQSLSETDNRVKAIYKGLAKAAQVDLDKSIDDTNKPKNPVIITQLLLDMHKNMVPYSALLKKGKNVFAKVLNRQTNPLQDEFSLRMAIHEPLAGMASIYNGEGKIDWQRLAEWNVESAEMFPTPKEDDKSLFGSLQNYAAGFFDKNKHSKVARREYLIRASKALGVPMTAKSADRILNNKTLLSTYTRALQEFRTETKRAWKGDIANDLKIIEKAKSLDAKHLTTEQKEKFNQALQRLNSRNMTYDTFRTATYGTNQESSKGAGQDRINKMLDVLADVSSNLKTERRIPWFDRKGKTNSRYSDRTPSYMGDMVDKIHEFVEEKDAQGLKDFIMDKWGHSSFFYDKTSGRFLNKWIQELYDSIKVDSKGVASIDKDAMAKVFEFDEFLGSNIDKNVSIFENFTEKQHAEAMLKQYVQPLDQSGGKSPLSKYPCFILGDSGAQMFFTAKRYSQTDILSGLKDAFRQELERMKYVKATNELLEKEGHKPIDNFSQTAEEFTMLKFLNSDFADGKYWKILTGNQDMTDAEVKALSKSDAVEQAKQALGTDALSEALQTYMVDALADFKKKLAAVGVLKESRGEGGAITYTDNNEYFKQNTRWYKNDIDKMVEDFFWNTKYATIQQLQMFTVDPAFYDHRYPVKDLQKRYKEIYAPGKGISTEARDFNGNLYTTRPYEKAVYFDDIEVSAEEVNPAFWKVLQETFKDNPKVLDAYKKNTLTDGQGYRSLSSYRAVKGMAGEWSMAMESAYQRIMEIRHSDAPLTDADIKELAELAVVMQPIKPYLYTLEKLQINPEGDMALIPVQHKYAEVVLIPELMQEGKLKDMAVWMEENDIDLIASTKCVKVGAFGSTQLAGINDTEGIRTALSKAKVHQLPWADYRIQSGVPEHLNHAQLFGTQIRKLILANINKGHTYDYLNRIFGTKTTDPRGLRVYLPGMGNVHLNGRNLISFYNCLIMGNLFDSYSMFAEDTTTNQKLSDKMLQNIISNANQAEDNAFGFSLIEDGEFKGEFVMPLGEPGLEHDASALLWSLFKKQVNKQKIKGGSAVQASALGLAGYEEVGDLFEVVSPEGDNVLYDEVEMPFNLSYTAATGKNVPLRFNDWCNPDGTLKMSDQIVYGKDAREYLSWPVSGRDKYGKAIDPEQGYYVPLVETKYKGILDIISYRIPTEREYSMINCKIFRFSNPLAGGTLKVPSSRTTTAGFDFDIDKLYFFMREFAQTHLSKADIENIWNAIYEEHPEWKRALREARNLDVKGQQYLNAFAGVYNNSPMMAEAAEANQTSPASRLFQYWESAGLEGTPEEAFNKYLEDHRKEYPVFDTYNPDVSPLNPVKDKKGNVITAGNSRVARNNMLIDLMRQRLMDKETLRARYTPGGFENNRDAALRMRVLQFADKADITSNGSIDWSKVDSYVQKIKNKELKDPEPEYDVSDPTAILVYNQQNQVAGKLIGIFANQNTNHVYASTMEELGLMKPIMFGNHATRGLSDMLHAPEGVNVDTNVSEYLAASVDAVKDPVLNFLNLNLTTADAGALLARIGYTPQEIGLLFNQPIIKDVCNYIANNSVSTDIAILEMLKRYGGDRASFKDFRFDSSQVTTDKLADNILKARDYIDSSKAPASIKEGQLQVLWLFNEIMADTADLNSFVQSTRFTAANSIGSTWGEQIAQEDRVRRFMERYGTESGEENTEQRLYFKLFADDAQSSRVVHLGEQAAESSQGILNIDENLLNLSPEEYMAQMSVNPLAFEQCMMDLSRKSTREIFQKHFPYYTQLYTNMRSMMNKLTKYRVLDADTINSLHREMIVYLLSKQTGSSFDGEAPNLFADDSGSITNREYYTRYYPRLLHALKTEGILADFPFFEALTITGDMEGDLSKPLQIKVQGMGGLQTRTSNLLTEMWAETFNSDATVHSDYFDADIPVKQLAQDLYFYNFYKLGYNFHPTSSMSLAPTLLKLGLRVNTATEQMGYVDFMQDVIHGNIHMDESDLTSFAKQYILNHLDNKKFVYTPKGTARKAVNGAFNEKEGHWNPTFTISYKQLGDLAGSFTIFDESLPKGMHAFRPVIAVEKGDAIAYYMADGAGDRFNVTSSADGTMTYRQVFAQGTKGQSIQYFSHAGFAAFQQKSNANIERSNPVEEAPETPINSIEESTDMMDGTADTNADGAFITMGQDISSMFTDAEWKQMIQELRSKYPQETQGVHNDDIRKLLMDTTDSQNLQIINELSRKLDRGEKMKTLDENGKEIDVC